MKTDWHVVKEDDRYVVLDNNSLSKLVPSITKSSPNKSTLSQNINTNDNITIENDSNKSD